MYIRVLECKKNSNTVVKDSLALDLNYQQKWPLTA